MRILHIRRLWRFAFATSVLFAMVMASLPQPPIPGDPPDTLLHVLAFAVLTALARAAYPQAKVCHILVGLSVLGGLIELIQLLPALGRNASLADWVADIVAVMLTLGMLRALQRIWGSPASSQKH